MSEKKWIPPASALLAFLLGLLLTFALTAWHSAQNSAVAQRQLALAGASLVESLRLRIAAFDLTLHGLRGALVDGKDAVGRFRDYDRVVDLQSLHPGAISVGYARRVAQGETDALLEQLGQHLGREIPLIAETVNNGDRFIVMEAVGPMAPGTDLAALGAARSAGMRSTWLNEAALSPPLFRPGTRFPEFFLMLAVYQDGTPPTTSIERHEKTDGWLFIHFSGERLMGGIADQSVALKLLDREIDDVHLVFDSRGLTPGERLERQADEAAPTTPRHEFEQGFGGRTWQFVVTPNTLFWDYLGQLSPALSGAAGVLVSLMAALLVYDLLGRQQRATALAQRMTVALRASEQQQRAILENASIGILFTAQRTVMHCNPKTAELFGWPSPQDLVGQPGRVFWRSDADYADVGRHASPVLSRGEIFEVERQMCRRDGSHFLARAKAKAIDPAAPALGTIWIIEDVTEQRRIERDLHEHSAALQHANDELAGALQRLEDTRDQLVQSEKLAALGTLVAGVAHEMNTPLGNALLATTTLHDQTRQLQTDIAAGQLSRSRFDGFIQDSLQACGLSISNLERAARLISSFKKIAVNQASTRRTRFKLAELVEGVTAILRSNLAGTAFALTHEVPDGLVLDSYPGEIEQILLGMVNNALTHGFDGREHGQVTISAAAADTPGFVVMSVCDDGNGIAEAALPHVFEPFFTTRMGSGGGGLGLHIIYNQVTGILGGTIEVTSHQGKGTCFRITLPTCASQPGDMT